MKAKLNILDGILNKMDGNQIQHFRAQNKPSQYLQLFNCLLDKAITTEELENKFGKKNLPTLRNYLYHQVLDFLLQYALTKNKDAQLEFEYQKITLLKNMGLWHAFSIELLRLEKKCVQQNAIHVLQKVAQEGISYYSKMQTPKDKLAFQRKLNLLQEVNQALIKYQAVSNFYYLIVYQIKSSRVITSATIQQNIDDAYQAMEAQAFGRYHPITQLKYYGAIVLYSYLLHREEMVLQYGKKYEDLFRTLKPSIDENHLLISYYIINNLIAIRQLKAAQKSLVSYKEISLSSKSLIAFRYYYYNCLQQRYLSTMSQYSQLTYSLGQLKRRYLSYFEFISSDQLSTLFTNALINNFLLARYDEATFWGNLLYTHESALRQEIKPFYRALMLLSFIELKEHDLLQRALAHSYRERKKSKFSFQFEKAIMDYAKLFLQDKLTSKDDRQLYKKIDTLQKIEEERQSMAPFRFLIYLQAKVEGKTYIQKKMELGG